MKLLLDSHAVIWAVDHPSKLSQQAAALLEDPANDLLLSAATIWEIAIKVGLNKMSLSLPYRQWMNRAIADLGLVLLPITVEYPMFRPRSQGIMAIRSTGFSPRRLGLRASRW